MKISRYEAIADDEETQLVPSTLVPSTIADSEPGAVPLRQGDIWKASKTWVNAFVNDPYILYLLADGKAVPTYRQRATNIAALSLWYRNNIMFTVDGGASLTITWPSPSTPKTPTNRFKDKLANWIMGVTQPTRTVEQQKRWEESSKKFSHVMSSVLPVNKIQEMLFVGLAATEPQCQGRGLGSAALGAVIAVADWQGRACWLVSSNVANDVFYNSHGFQTVGKIYLGESNPEWKKEPIIVQVMVRESKTKVERSPSTSPPSAPYGHANPLLLYTMLL